MGLLTYSHTLVAGTNENINDVQDMFNDARTVINGNLDSTNFSTATNQYVGLSDTSIRRGKTIIATAQSTSSSTYAVLSTPDRVSNVVLPTDGLLAITFDALWKLTAAQAIGTHKAHAAIFIGGNQFKTRIASGAPSAQEILLSNVSDPSTKGFYVPLQTGTTGLTTPFDDTGRTADTTLVTTGLSVITTTVWLAAGTYDVEIRFKSDDNTNPITVKDRKLWVTTTGF